MGGCVKRRLYFTAKDIDYLLSSVAKAEFLNSAYFDWENRYKVLFEDVCPQSPYPPLRRLYTITEE